MCTVRIYSTISRRLVAKHWYMDCRPQSVVFPVNTVHCVLLKTVSVVRVLTTRVIRSVSKCWLVIKYYIANYVERSIYGLISDKVMLLVWR